jgi:uncharacterized protein (TIGR02145 family)
MVKFLISRIMLFLAVIISMLILSTCIKEPDPPDGKSSFVTGSLPALTLGNAYEITFTSSKIDVNLTSTGSRKVKKLLLCYSSQNTNPDTTNQTVNLGETNEKGTFTASLTNLTHNTPYYYRAYARNQEGSVYTAAATFPTQKDLRLPEVTTVSASNITINTASLSGTIISFGQSSSTATQHGHVWATQNNPTLSDNKTQLGSTNTTTITSNLTGLTESTTYYFRAYATNSTGTSYSSVLSFTTCGTPKVSTDSINSVTGSNFIVYATVTESADTPITERGIYYSTNPDPVGDTLKADGLNALGSYSILITGLRASTKYYVKAYAKNKFATSFGSVQSVTTLQADLPRVTTSSVNAISYDTARCGGNVTSDGGGVVTSRGVCWGKAQNPTVSDSFTQDGTGTGSFVSTIKGLNPGTQYYIRAYATNASGTAYGSTRSFTTIATSLPVVSTTTATAITKNSATSGGNISSDGGASITARGICWSTSANPTTALSTKTSDGTGAGSFTSSLTGLTANTTYYVRAYATNSVGTAYGSQVSFTTRSIFPTLTTTDITGISSISATSGGNISFQGDSPVTVRGVCWNTTGTPTISNSKTTDGSGTGSFTSSISGLTPGTAYFIRAYATNTQGTGYGNQLQFTTQSDLAVLTTTDVSNITQTTATGGGNITDQGGAPVTERGVCWNTSGNPTISDSKTTNGPGTGSFTSSLSGLTAGTRYFVRAYATNSYGTSYGSQLSFNTNGPTISDVDGNTYTTVVIGTQTWIAENLKTTKYNDNTAITNITSASTWVSTTSGAYCWYDNNSSNKATYGALYNWYAVNTGKLCPTGWHVPTDVEWTTMENYLIDNGYNYDGTTTGNKIAKSLATASGWTSNTGTGTVGNTDYPTKRNVTGFSALPGGVLTSAGFSFGGGYGYGWSTTEDGSSNAWHRGLLYTSSSLTRYSNLKSSGFSVRCLKD